MIVYTVRYRHCTIHEVAVEATSYKDAFNVFTKKLSENRFHDNEALGVTCSIETITMRDKNDYQNEHLRVESELPTRRIKSKRLVSSGNGSDRANDCESAACKD